MLKVEEFPVPVYYSPLKCFQEYSFAITTIMQCIPFTDLWDS